MRTWPVDPRAPTAPSGEREAVGFRKGGECHSNSTECSKWVADSWGGQCGCWPPPHAQLAEERADKLLDLLRRLRTAFAPTIYKREANPLLVEWDAALDRARAGSETGHG